jgi:hypothetical protein
VLLGVVTCIILSEENKVGLDFTRKGDGANAMVKHLDDIEIKKNNSFLKYTSNFTTMVNILPDTMIKGRIKNVHALIVM